MVAILSVLVVAALLIAALALITTTLVEGAPAILRALNGGMTSMSAPVARRRQVRFVSRRPVARAPGLRAAA